MPPDSSPQIERAGWMTEHPVTGEKVAVVTMDWFREVRTERDALLNAAHYVILEAGGEPSLRGLQRAMDACRPRKSDAEIRRAIGEVLEGPW